MHTITVKHFVCYGIRNTYFMFPGKECKGIKYPEIYPERKPGRFSCVEGFAPASFFFFWLNGYFRIPVYAEPSLFERERKKRKMDRSSLEEIQK